MLDSPLLCYCAINNCCEPELWRSSIALSKDVMRLSLETVGGAFILVALVQVFIPYKVDDIEGSKR